MTGATQEEVNDFVTVLKRAVEQRDCVTLARIADFPLGVRLKAGETVLRGPDELIKHCDEILTDSLRRDVAYMNPYRLSSRTQGFTVGCGGVWFSPFSRRVGGTPEHLEGLSLGILLTGLKGYGYESCRQGYLVDEPGASDEAILLGDDVEGLRESDVRAFVAGVRASANGGSCRELVPYVRSTWFYRKGRDGKWVPRPAAEFETWCETPAGRRVVAALTESTSPFKVHRRHSEGRDAAVS